MAAPPTQISDLDTEGESDLSQEADASFIETQFPVSKLSKESYKERKANYSQTLTGLGKWWDRKPLILVRAAILGLLLPASADPIRDRAIFLKLLTMDPEGLWLRKSKSIQMAVLLDQLRASERERWFDLDSPRPRYRKGLTRDDKDRLQRLVFERMGYDERLTYCDRPEQIDGPSESAWAEINAHLGTSAGSLPDLVRQLGRRRFGHVPRVGDAFCGGGSVPFEAARIGCDAYGSDLNPVAALLTWGALNIVGGGEAVAQRVREAQGRVFAEVDRQITDWRIEHNAKGWRADAYLYCTETRCPECGCMVPLAPSWIIGERTMTIARLVRRPDGAGFEIKVTQDVTPDELAAAKGGTVRDSRLRCPCCNESTPMSAIRGDRRIDGQTVSGLRPWENADLVPRPDDVFQERLYCVRWRLPDLTDLLLAEQHQRAGRYYSSPVPDWVSLDDAIAGVAEFLDASDRLDLEGLRERDWLAEDQELADAAAELEAFRKSKAPKAQLDAARKRLRTLRNRQAQLNADLKALSERIPGARYLSAGPGDVERDERVLALLRERFDDWQAKGYIPSRRIEPGDKTDEPIRTRGWTHWHQLFTPRQLLILGLIAKKAIDASGHPAEKVAYFLGVARCTNWTSRLTGWDPSAGNEKSNATFQNQALNVMSVYAVRSLPSLTSAWYLSQRDYLCSGKVLVQVADARSMHECCDMWLTDPPYADAIVYHELSEFFLAWYDKHLSRLFPQWTPDSKRQLAIRGSGKDFREGMVAAYRNLAEHMPANGMQIVMFTHQDAGVWADLALILWAAGLRVTAAWTIATETESALKEGNYVQGTVLMVLRKQTSDEVAFLDEIVPQVEIEVEAQLESMLALDDREDPNFSDADYQLAAYAAALRVLTQYRTIEDIDVAYELARGRKRGETSPIESIIEDAVRTASNFLVPAGLDGQLWRRLSGEEKLYLKCLEVESHGDYRSGVFQEFARGFGVRDYRFMLQSGKANQTRLRTASELKRREWSTPGFGSSLLRHALFAVYQAADREDTKAGLTYLKTEVPDYWTHRETLVALAGYLGRLPIPDWSRDAEAARLLAGALDNDHV